MSAGHLALYLALFAAAALPGIPGDADGDRDVDLDDFVRLKQNFGRYDATGPAQGDFDSNGTVDLDDFVILKNNFGADGGETFIDDFDPGWDTQQTDWRVATWMQNGTQMAKDRCKTDGQGFLVQTVLAGEPYRGGSMQSKAEYPYGRWVASLRPSHVAGALNSMFTKDWDDMTTPGDDSDGTGFEVDIEFLTWTFGPGHGKVHVAIHMAGASNYHVADINLDFNPSDGFHEWGFEIRSDRVDWLLDGEIFHTWNAPAHITIPDNYEMFFNSWTKDTWINGPPITDAHYYIDYVTFTPLGS